MNETEFLAGLLSYMRPKYAGLAAMVDDRPEVWTDSINRVRELCVVRGYFGEKQYPFIVANLFAPLSK